MTDATATTIETPHGVAVLRDACAACGQATILWGAESRAEAWATVMHENVCCGKVEACKDADCITHHPW